MSNAKNKLGSKTVRIEKFKDGKWHQHDDMLSTEEPLEIRIETGAIYNRRKKNVAITMRTPGNDDELAMGFLFSEGILQGAQQVLWPAKISGTQGGVLTLLLHPDVVVDETFLQRNFYTTSSCGVCGKESIEALNQTCPVYTYYPKEKIKPAIILSLPQTLRAQQDLFESTGGLHACALFTQDGQLEMIREDVGRHNALDKLIGAQLMAAGDTTLTLGHKILLLSGRASFELIQKAAMAGIRYVCAVGAPSSLAVETAQQFDITLIGFLRDGRFNVYHGAESIAVNT